jgi:hypothetical protein
MRLVPASAPVVLLTACSQAVTPAGLGPQEMPDTIPCDNAVVIKAANTDKGIAAERRWLDKHYPHHGQYNQGLRGGPNGRIYDVLTFRRREGGKASVCFDISSFYGQL